MTRSGDVVSDTATLARLCDRLAAESFVCVDTEFLRETTYWPKLCLIQLCGASGAPCDLAVVDPLAEGLDLAPFYELLTAPDVRKVLHAAGQDLEAFHHDGGVVARPLFDTQVAAEFCGHGEQPSYESLVRAFAGARIDKGARRTDWSRRPLGDRQIRYALDDVRHLPAIYRGLEKRLEELGRTAWAEEEIAALVDPSLFPPDPRRTWTRVRTSSREPRYLAIVRELAAWREVTARERDVPRQRVMPDATLREVAALRPADERELRSLRPMSRRRRAQDAHPSGIIEAVQRGIACPEERLPVPLEAARLGARETALAALLGVFLKSLAAEHGIAERMIATADDVRRLAQDPAADVPVLSGWRRAVAGEALLRARTGGTALAVRGDRIVPVPAPEPG